MKALIEKMRREPALLTGLVVATMSVLAAFNVSLTDGQQAAITGFAVAVGAIIVRQRVTPNVSVGALEDNQANVPGELMAGQASDVPVGDPVDVVPHDEHGALDNGLLIALACIIIIICGIVWLVQAF